MEDEEIDFDRVLREEKITLPKPVSWTAHWLAVEGVQPLISENPPAITRDAEESSTLKSIAGQPSTSTLTTQSTVKGRQQTQQLVKQVLSRELQLYYARLTSSLLPPVPEDYFKRTGAPACRLSYPISSDGLRRGLSIPSELDPRPRRMGECLRCFWM